MASASPPGPPDLAQALQAAFERAPWALPVGVAYSGGADSSALLRLASNRWPGQVVALHVHHGLQAAADGFALHAAHTCAALQLPLHTARIDARHAAGDSPEDAARQARYAALAGLAAGAGVTDVLLAQHADDQVETVLLALSRGAGLPGLAGMPSRFTRQGCHFHRPWLNVPGMALRAWLSSQGHAFVEDPSNQELAFTRNRIRHQIVPTLAAAFPAFRETFARSARHAAQAQGLLEDLARHDLALTGVPPRLAPLQALSPDRQANLLRHWLKSEHGTAPSTAQLGALLPQVAVCRTRGHRIHLKVGHGCVTRQGERLVYAASV